MSTIAEVTFYGVGPGRQRHQTSRARSQSSSATLGISRAMAFDRCSPGGGRARPRCRDRLHRQEHRGAAAGRSVGLALSLNVDAVPDSVSQDGGRSQSVRSTASARTAGRLAGLADAARHVRRRRAPRTTGRCRRDRSSPAATASRRPSTPRRPPGPRRVGTCTGFPGNFVTIVATPTSTDFATDNPIGRSSASCRRASSCRRPTRRPRRSRSRRPGDRGRPARFDASSSKPGTARPQITTYSWDFGDGATGTGMHADAHLQHRGRLHRRADRHQRPRRSPRPRRSRWRSAPRRPRRVADARVHRSRPPRQASTRRCSSTPRRRPLAQAIRFRPTRGPSATVVRRPASPSATRSPPPAAIPCS